MNEGDLCGDNRLIDLKEAKTHRMGGVGCILLNSFIDFYDEYKKIDTELLEETFIRKYKFWLE